jgi:hypothetical protein
MIIRILSFYLRTIRICRLVHESSYKPHERYEWQWHWNAEWFCLAPAKIILDRYTVYTRFYAHLSNTVIACNYRNRHATLKNCIKQAWGKHFHARKVFAGIFSQDRLRIDYEQKEVRDTLDARFQQVNKGNVDSAVPTNLFIVSPQLGKYLCINISLYIYAILYALKPEFH